MYSNKSNKDLLKIAIEEEYLFKASWVYNKIHELGFFGFKNEISLLIDNSTNYSWERYLEWGITQSSYNTIIESNISLIRIFLHPKILREHPKLLAYYRSISTLSQKALGKLVSHPKSIETGVKASLKTQLIMDFTNCINNHMSAIIDSTAIFNEDEISGLLFVTAGAQIDGSWKNEKGDIAERYVKKILFNHYLKKNQIVSIINKNNDPEKLSNIEKINSLIKEIKGFKLSNKYSVLYSSEPDLAIIAPDSKKIATIEVKGGQDTAGALERFGAAIKSLSEDLKENPDCITILVANVGTLTEEVTNRFPLQTKIKKYFNLTKIIRIEEEKLEFFDFIESLMS